MDRNNIYKIRFKRPDDGKVFVNLMTTYFDEDIDIRTDLNNRRVYDAKSLLGVLSLDLSKDLYVSIITDNEESVRKFEAIIRQFQD